MSLFNELFVGCPVRNGWVDGFVLQICDEGIDPNVLVSNGIDDPQWLYAMELNIARWEEPENVSRLIHKQMLNEVSNG